MADKITYPNKTNNPLDPDSVKKFFATEANEIKSVVNGISDEVEGLSNGDGRVYGTLAEALAVTPIPADNVPFQVSETGDPTNAGYYFYKDGGDIDGKAEFSRAYEKPRTGIITTEDRYINFDLISNSIEVTGGPVTVTIKDRRYIANVPQSIAIPSNSGYFFLIFSPSTYDFYVLQSDSPNIAFQSYTDVVCATFRSFSNSGLLYVTGLKEYYINGEPERTHISEWKEDYYAKGDVVYHGPTQRAWIADQNTLPESVPNISSRWKPIFATHLNRATLIAEDSSIDFDTDNYEITFSGIMSIVYERSSYVPNVPQTLSFSGLPTRYIVVMYNRSDSMFYLDSSNNLHGYPSEYLIVFSFVRDTSNQINVNGINQYYINGEPKYNRIHKWTPDARYKQGAVVSYRTELWEALSSFGSGARPGSSHDLWARLTRGWGQYIAPADKLNFDIVNRKIETAATAVVLMNNARYLVTPGQSVSFPSGGSFYVLLFHPSGTLSTIEVNDMTSLDPKLIIIATFYYSTGAPLVVNGINQYYINGEPNTSGSEIAPIVLDQELPYYNAVTTRSMTENDPTPLVETTSDFLYGLYDDLMADFPDYISKTQYGVQDDGEGGTLPLYYYRFKPSNLLIEDASTSGGDHTIKIFMSVCIHGFEKNAGISAYELMNDICNRWKEDEYLEALRWNFEIVVCVLASPYGWNYNAIHGGGAGRKNANGVDPNRNFPVSWGAGSDDPNSSTYRGPSALSEPECQALAGLAEQEYKQGAIALDFHSFQGSESGLGSVPTWIVAPDYMNPAAQAFGRRATREYKKKVTVIDPSDDAPLARISPSQVGGLAYKYYQALGYKSYLVEVSDNFRPVAGFERYDNNAIKFGTESFGNMLRMAIKAVLK